MRIGLADGTDALATVRTLKAPYGQIAIVHPIELFSPNGAPSPLRLRHLLHCDDVVLLAVASAYSGSRAARKADQKVLSHSPPARRGALARPLRPVGLGPCARPHLLVGLDVRAARPARRATLPVLRGTQCPPPSRRRRPGRNRGNGRRPRRQDASTTSSDASTDGRWIWLRARAQIVCGPGRSRRPHLVGIAIDISEQKSLAERARQPHAPARRDRRGLRSLRPVGLAQPACHVQFQVPRFHKLPRRCRVAPAKATDGS